jgi:hypothetical protein
VVTADPLRYCEQLPEPKGGVGRAQGHHRGCLADRDIVQHAQRPDDHPREHEPLQRDVRPGEIEGRGLLVREAGQVRGLREDQGEQRGEQQAGGATKDRG